MRRLLASLPEPAPMVSNQFCRTWISQSGVACRLTTSGLVNFSSRSGSGMPGTSGTLAVRMPRLARKMEVGVSDVRDTPVDLSAAEMGMTAVK